MTSVVNEVIKFLTETTQNLHLPLLDTLGYQPSKSHVERVSW